MVKVNVTFNFDPTTETITDVLCSVGEAVAKKATSTTVKKSTVKQVGKELQGLSIIREDGKLVLSPEVIAMLEEGAGEEVRVSIKYQKFPVNGVDVVTPLFGREDFFGGKGGNKLAKAGTVAYRGKSNEILADFGTNFTLELWKDGIYKMIGDKEFTPKETLVKDAVAKVKDIEVLGDETTEIEEFEGFTL